MSPVLPGPPIRRHVNLALDLTDLADISAAYAELAARPLPDVDALALWLRAWSELESLLDEELVRRGIAMNCAVDDPRTHAAHRDFVDRLAPHIKPLSHDLARRLVDHPHAHDLDPAQHACLLRTLRDQVDIYSDDVALEVEEQHLIAETMRLRTGVTVLWNPARGVELDYPADHEPRDVLAMRRPIELVEAELDQPDRARREAAWRAVNGRVLIDHKRYAALFDRLYAVRKAQARAAGAPDVRAHRFRLLGRRDYGVDECLELHAAIEAEVVPFASELLHQRRDLLGLTSVRPWDLTAPLGPADVTHPFTDEYTLVDGIQRAIASVDPELGQQFARLARHDMLDLLARPGKSPGAFQCHLGATGLPFVFASAVGRREDLWTVLHEAGHALHALACADDPLMWNRTPPLEFAELASTAMELMAGTHLDAFFDESASRAARREQLVQAVLFLPHVACVDAFQHWLYTDPFSATWASARDLCWRDLHQRSSPAVDWHGLELERSRQWLRQSHLFTAPFYVIEYGIAQLGALQLLERYLDDPTATVAAYRDALALGGRASLRDLFAAAGLRLDFSRAHVARCMAFVRRELARLA